MAEERIGLALSGGGSRAIAFHLGTLRALNKLGLLERLEVLSTVSGGSVIGALYAAHEGDFESFEEKVKGLLRAGLVARSVKKAVTSWEGPLAAFCWSRLAAWTLANKLLTFLSWTASWPLSIFFPAVDRKKWIVGRYPAPFMRHASRTTILKAVLNDDVFQKRTLQDIQQGKPELIVNAADLRTGSAFYFSARASGSWRLGELGNNNVLLAHAVSASAAYPLALPALDEAMGFNKKDGTRRVERVTLTDGGVYDNLGLSPLWPDRDPDISLLARKLDIIICSRAGNGLRFDEPSQLLLSRMEGAFNCILGRAENAATKRLFDLRNAGTLKGFAMPYLGQDDSRLKFPPSDLVTREEAINYPTDFWGMSDDWIEKLSTRGEQLTIATIKEHLPHLSAD